MFAGGIRTHGQKNVVHSTISILFHNISTKIKIIKTYNFIYKKILQPTIPGTIPSANSNKVIKITRFNLSLRYKYS